MSFSWFDIVALVVLGLGLLHGWRAGFIVMVGNLASLVVGVVASAYAATWLSSHWGWTGVQLIAAFVVLALVAAKLARLVVWFVDRIWKVISILPLLGPLNRLFGAVIGAVEAAVLLVIVTYLFMNYWLPNINGLVDSFTFEVAYNIARRLTLLLPTL